MGGGGVVGGMGGFGCVTMCVQSSRELASNPFDKIGKSAMFGPSCTSSGVWSRVLK
jgi:hypothetical protein